ncbi:hypothetical protein MKW98_005391 [Papaver atlanticum]|uniref:Uncharacterized protein n=1 Tax=Papaver atlanticum TaxID=357466 RepID=A0AAD4RWY1_9MAGN|nr:hypothetical protein MKW98_005391 [Papaver atlanticum]
MAIGVILGWKPVKPQEYWQKLASFIDPNTLAVSSWNWFQIQGSDHGCIC